VSSCAPKPGKIGKLHRRCLLLLAINPLLAHASAQDSGTQVSRNEIAIFSDYSHTSSHILIGISDNRSLALSGIRYSRLIGHAAWFDWSYDAEIIPVGFLRDPVSTTTQLITFTSSSSTFGPYIIQSGPIQSSCQSSTYLDPQSGTQAGVTLTDQRVCGVRWTYFGGVSPLGQRLTFLPGRRLQPSISANAGFIASTRDIPEDQSSRFNFTFQFGAGLQVHSARNHTFFVEYLVHHISNADLGNHNAGVDNQIIRVGYVFGDRRSR
jgi:hypothetical protein